MKAGPPLCTKYDSLYPTDSANQEIAIPRIAANRKENIDNRILPQASSSVPAQIRVHRRYQSEPSALDELVEALYRLITEGNDLAVGRHTSPSIEATDSTCFSAQQE
jgi:methyl coenzyme M reductase subunit C-like uncharacterized protein (methanogenesis marker protein 7)